VRTTALSYSGGDAARRSAAVRLGDIVRLLRRLETSPILVLEGEGMADVAGGATLVCAGARAMLAGRGERLTLTMNGRRRHLSRTDVASAIRTMLGFSRSALAGAPAGVAGVYGILGFEAAGYCESLRYPGRREGDPDAPDLLLFVPQVVCTVDEARGEVRVDGDAELAIRLRVRGTRTRRYADQPDVGRTAARGVRSADAPVLRALNPPGWFVRIVGDAQAAIAAGEAYQIVLSQAWEGICRRDPWDAYAAMQSINPSPYMLYMETPRQTLAGASPEMLCRVRAGRAAVRPLAGTRRRPSGARIPADLVRGLQADPKERAEHVMLVDLARNDLNRVCRPGSVRVQALCRAETYSHVIHMASHVEGDLAAGYDAVDVLQACFPAGTVSGAPKLRALQLIADLEERRRGWYAGSIVRLGADGSLDASLVLRSAVFFNGRVRVQAGAGIVAASVPEREDAECRAKAQAAIAALGMEAAP
jgi:anthranilate synthase component 1